MSNFVGDPVAVLGDLQQHITIIANDRMREFGDGWRLVFVVFTDDLNELIQLRFK